MAVVGHGAGDGDGYGRQHQGRGRVGNPEGQQPRRQDEAPDQGRGTGAHGTGHRQGDPGVQAPALDGGRQHEAPDEQKEDRVGIGFCGIGGVRRPGQRQGDKRDQGRRGDRDRLCYPPDQHQGHDRDDPPGLDRQAFRRAHQLKPGRNHRAQHEPQLAPQGAQPPAFARPAVCLNLAGGVLGHDHPSLPLCA